MSDVDKNSESFWVGWAGVIVALISAGVLWAVLGALSPTFGHVAALILVGFAAFVILMNILSYAAYVLNITDRTQPFGLPEGSVRAILTLSLIVLVGVLASFLITAGSRTRYETTTLQTGITQDAANVFVKSHPDLVASISIEDKTPDEKDAGKKGYQVVLKTKVEDRLSEDISKQILTMLSTILAAMIGFYFGSKTDNVVEKDRRDDPPPASPAEGTPLAP